MPSKEIEQIIKYKNYALACVLGFVIVLGLITFATIQFEVFIIEVFLMRLMTLIIVIAMYVLVIRILNSYQKHVLK